MDTSLSITTQTILIEIAMIIFIFARLIMR